MLSGWLIVFKQFYPVFAKMVYNGKGKVDAKFDDVADILPGLQRKGEGWARVC
jgi:hypothetical protein